MTLAVCVVDIATICYFLTIRPNVNIKTGIGPEPGREKLAQEKLLKKSFQRRAAGIPPECLSSFLKLHLN